MSYPKSLPLPCVHFIANTVRTKKYAENRADFVYACWETVGWYAFKKFGAPKKIGADKPKLRSPEEEAALTLKQALADAEHDIKNALGLYESGDAIANCTTGVALVDCSRWVRLLIEELDSFLSL